MTSVFHCINYSRDNPITRDTHPRPSASQVSPHSMMMKESEKPFYTTSNLFSNTSLFLHSLLIQLVPRSVPGGTLHWVVVVVTVDLLPPPDLLVGHHSHDHPEQRVLHHIEHSVGFVLKLVIDLSVKDLSSGVLIGIIKVQVSVVQKSKPALWPSVVL